MGMKFEKVAHHGENTLGRDFVVGDVHGMFYMLEELLKGVSFNEERDRLFSVGDLVDRGAQSVDAREWIYRKWFLPVRGNHEQMAIEFVFNKNMRTDIYVSNGGKWFTELTKEEQLSFAEDFAALPYARTFTSGGYRWGIVHADIQGTSFDDFTLALENDEDRASEIAMWSRSRISAHKTGYKTTRITDLTGLIVGHTPLKEATALENVIYIDTGGCFKGGQLTLVEVKEDTWHVVKP